MRVRTFLVLLALLFLSTSVAEGRDLGAVADWYLDGASETLRYERDVAALAPDATLVLFRAEGPGALQRLEFQCGAITPEVLRGAVLEFHWDGAREPQVRVPFGDFFGVVAGHMMNLEMDPLSTNGHVQGRFTSYFPMPYADGAAVVLRNDSPFHLPEFRMLVIHNKRPAPADGRRFFAQWSRSHPVPRRSAHLVLQHDGHLVMTGFLAHLDPGQPGPWDEALLDWIRDGEPAGDLPTRSLLAFAGQSWGMTPELNTTERGILDVETGGALFYRFPLYPPLEFTGNLEMEIRPQHRLAGPRQDTITSMVYGYTNNVTATAPVLPRFSERLPLSTGLLASGAGFEAENLIVTARSEARPPTLLYTERPRTIFSGGAALEMGFSETGDYVEFEIEAPSSDNFRLGAVVQRRPDGGRFHILLDGKPLRRNLDLFRPLARAWDYAELGEVHLEEGKHGLRFIVAGRDPMSTGYELLLDAFSMEVAERAFVRKWLLVGPFAMEAPPPGSTELGEDFARRRPPEEEFDEDAVYDGGLGEISWNWYAPGESGYVDLYEDLPVKYVQQGVAYALTHIYTPDDRRLMGYFGSDDGAAIWLNGRRIYNKPLQRAYVTDEDAIPLDLREGWNSLLIKIGNTGGGWGFALRLPAPEGMLEFSPYPPKGE